MTTNTRKRQPAPALTEEQLRILKRADTFKRMNCGIMLSGVVEPSNDYAVLVGLGLIDLFRDGCYWITDAGRAALESESES